MEITYARLPERVKAAVIDSLVVVALMYGVSEIFALFESVPNEIRVTAFILIFIVYDPIFTSSFGGTIGHSYSKIMVKSKKDPKRNLSFPMAVIRFIWKALLGWISLLTVTMDSQKMAIHDVMAGSVVISEN